MSAPPRLRLLGLPTATNAQAAAMPQKARVLLVRLLLTPQPLRRTAILPLLWPTATEGHARGSLRVTLHTLRRTLGPDSLRADRQQVALHRPPPSDLQDFLDAVRNGHDVAAVQHYAGPLLADVTLYDTIDGDLWLESERRRLARLFEAAARRLLQSTDAATLPAPTQLAVARRLRDSDPEQVLHWVLLLNVVSRVGAPEELLRERTALEARLEGGDVSDIRAAQALLPVIRPRTTGNGRGRSGTVPAMVDSRSVTNHGAALTALEADWRRVAQGSSSCLLVTGQSGIGKSVLLAALQHRLANGAAAVTTVRASRSGRDLPFAMLREVVGRLLEHPGALQRQAISARSLAALDQVVADRLGISNPPPYPQDTPKCVAGLVRGVRDLLRQVAAESPSALLLDDLHWSDAISRRILRRAAGTVNGAPLLVVAASRVPMGAAWLGWPRLHLLPLPTPDARVLLQQVAPVLPAETIECLLQHAGGVPLRLLHGARLAEELAEQPTTPPTHQLAKQPTRQPWEYPAAPDAVPPMLHDEATWREGPVAARLRLLLTSAPETAPWLAMLALWDAPLSTAELASLALWDAPRSTAELASVHYTDGSTPAHDRLRARLGSLRDLVAPLPGDRWHLTHDRIADAVLRVSSPSTLHLAAIHLVRLFAGRADSPRDVHQWQRLSAGYAALLSTRSDRTAQHGGMTRASPVTTTRDARPPG